MQKFCVCVVLLLVYLTSKTNSQDLDLARPQVAILPDIRDTLQSNCYWPTVPVTPQIPASIIEDDYSYPGAEMEARQTNEMNTNSSVLGAYMKEESRTDIVDPELYVAQQLVRFRISMDVCPSRRYYVRMVKHGNEKCWVWRPHGVSYVRCSSRMCSGVISRPWKRYYCIPKYVRKTILIYCRSFPYFRYHTFYLPQCCNCRMFLLPCAQPVYTPDRAVEAADPGW